MVNLIRFREKAESADGRETDLTGEEADAIHGEWMRSLRRAPSSCASARRSGTSSAERRSTAWRWCGTRAGPPSPRWRPTPPFAFVHVFDHRDTAVYYAVQTLPAVNGFR